MSSTSLGFFTVDGDALAMRLVSGVCADVEADRITRRQALDRTAYALERVGEMDNGIREPETLDAVAERLSLSFPSAGFMSVGGFELRRHYDAWLKGGAPIAPHVSCAIDPTPILRASQALSDALAVASSRSGVSVDISAVTPFESGFETLGADISVFSWVGDVSGVCYAGCFVSADGARPCGYIEDVMNHPAIEKAFAAELRCIASSLKALNSASNRINEPDRLSLDFISESGVISVKPTWDGDRIHAFSKEVFEVTVSHERHETFDDNTLETASSVDEALADGPAMFG